MIVTYKGIDALARVRAMSDGITELKKLPQHEAPVKHHFSEGTYTREVYMQAGLHVIGKIHKTRYTNIVTKGKCTVMTPTRTLEINVTDEPFIFESFEGEQKAAVIHEDTVWITVHHTNETDLAKIEEEVIAEHYTDELLQQLTGGPTLCHS